jgi:hypothetical protein
MIAQDTGSLPPGLIEATSLRPTPVTQDEMDAGSIELS